MTKKLKVDHHAVDGASTRIRTAAKKADDISFVSANLKSGTHSVFNAVVGDVVSDLESKLPSYLELVLVSYAEGLDDLIGVVRNADDELSTKAGHLANNPTF